MALANRVECRALESFLDAYVDGEFEARETADVEAHLATCSYCRSRASTQASYKDAIRRAGTSPGAPGHLRGRILTALSDPAAYDRLGLEEDELARPAPTPGRWWNGTKGIAAAAAVAGAAVWFAAGGLDRPAFNSRSRPQPPLVEDGVAMHARTLPLDYVATDPADVQRWLQGRLDFGVHVPRFAQTAAVQGVRLSTVRTRQAAAVAYSVPKASSGRVTLLIVDDPESPMTGVARRVDGRDVYLSHARGYNVASWRKDEIVYSLISDLDERDVLELVKAAQER